MEILILFIFLCPPLLMLVLGVLGLFFPIGYVALFLAWFSGLLTVLGTASALYGFDITSADDWKMLAACSLIPGCITAFLVFIGNRIGETSLFEILEMLKNFFG